MPVGRKPKPTSQLKLSGGWRIEQGQRDREPQLPTQIPPQPETLTAGAARVWSEVVALLEPMQVCTASDVIALSMLCEFVSKYRMATDQIEKHGMLIPITGNTLHLAWKPNPYVAMQQDYAKRVVSLAAEFGLTPSSRARLKTHDEAKRDTLFSRKAAIG